MSFVKIAKEFLMAVKGELDPHTTQKGIVKVRNFFTVELLTPAHIQYAKYGRGPGKLPPISEIEEWVKSKGIVSASEAKGTAFAIAKSISKNGTKNYVKGAPNALEAALAAHMESFVAKQNEYHLNKTNDKHVDEMTKVVEAAIESVGKGPKGGN